MVMTIITAPSALISGLIEVRSMAKILVGTVSMPGFFQNRVAVMLSKLKRRGEQEAADDRRRDQRQGDLEEGLDAVGAQRSRPPPRNVARRPTRRACTTSTT